MRSAIDVERREHVAVLRLPTPGGKAVMNAVFFRDLRSTFEAIDRDAGVRAVVVVGPEKGFSFGLDLAEAGPMFTRFLDARDTASRLDLLELIEEWQAAIGAVAKCRKPTVVAISGWCVGGGVDLAAACDVRLASAEAKFSIREARMGIVADLGSLQRLVGVIGEGHLRELALTGDDFDAARALQIGLVNHLLPAPAEAVERAVDIGDRIARNSPLVTRGIKRVLDVDRDRRVDAGLDYTAVWNAAFLLSDDLREAFDASSAGRVPEFKGK